MLLEAGGELGEAVLEGEVRVEARLREEAPVLALPGRADGARRALELGEVRLPQRQGEADDVGRRGRLQHRDEAVRGRAGRR